MSPIIVLSEIVDDPWLKLIAAPVVPVIELSEIVDELE